MIDPFKRINESRHGTEPAQVMVGAIRLDILPGPKYVLYNTDVDVDSYTHLNKAQYDRVEDVLEAIQNILLKK